MGHSCTVTKIKRKEIKQNYTVEYQEGPSWTQVWTGLRMGKPYDRSGKELSKVWRNSTDLSLLVKGTKKGARYVSQGKEILPSPQECPGCHLCHQSQEDPTEEKKEKRKGRVSGFLLRAVFQVVWTMSYFRKEPNQAYLHFSPIIP